MVMVTAQNLDDELPAPLWIRRPEMLHLLAYTAAGFSFTGQIVATILRDADWRVVLVLRRDHDLILGHRNQRRVLRMT